MKEKDFLWEEIYEKMYKTQKQLENSEDGEYENELIDDKEFQNYEYRKDKKYFNDDDDKADPTVKAGKGRARQ